MCDDFTNDCGDNFGEGLNWQSWMIIGPLSEQIGEEMREQDHIQRDKDNPDDDYGTLSIDDDEL